MLSSEKKKKINFNYKINFCYIKKKKKKYILMIITI